MRKITPSARRKYYLNRIVRRFCAVNSRAKRLTISEAEKAALTARNRAYFEELINQFSYNVQYPLPL